MKETANKPILEVKDLVKQYHDEMAAGQGAILDHLNLSIEPGEFVCILGPSGCGKSTFLRCVAGFEDFKGDILLEGKKVKTPGSDRIMVFQDFAQLFPWKTVEKNIQYPLRQTGIRDRQELARLSQEYLAKVELADYGKYYPHMLSGGMKQRVAIARALAMKPKLILMDEPLASLDAMTRNNLQAEIRNIHEKEKMTVIFITHNIQEAICLGTRIVVMTNQGQIRTDIKNPIPRPATPNSPGYGEMWEKLHDDLYAARTEEK